MSENTIIIRPDNTSPPNQIIQPYARIFALEIQQTDIIIRGKGNRQAVLITPSGARVSKLFICGALTEIYKNTKGRGHIRIADPTGVLTVHLKMKNPDIYSVLDGLSPPAFVSITCFIEASTESGGEAGFKLILDAVYLSTRSARDRWILRTGQHTLLRLKRLSEILFHGSDTEDEKRIIQRYKTGPRQLKVLAGMIEKAVNQVQEIPPETGVTGTLEEERPDITAEKILQLIKQHSGPKGVSIKELIPIAGKEKIPESLLIDTIRTLIAEDEIYQPSSGFVKIL